MTYSQTSKVIICSVIERESGFVDYRFIASKAADDLGFQVVRNPESGGMTQEAFEQLLRRERPIVVYLVGKEGSEATSREVRLALENGCDVHVFCRADNRLTFEAALEHVREISVPLCNYDCVSSKTAEELYEQVSKRLRKSRETAGQRRVSFFNRNQTYKMSTEVVEAARTSIVLVQRTSTLFVGPHRTTEFQFYSALREWLCNSNGDANFVHVFCRKDTHAEMKKFKVDPAKRYIELADELEGITASCKIDCLPREIDPFLLTDRDFAASVRLGDGNYCFRCPRSIVDFASATIVEDVFEADDYQPLYDSQDGLDRLEDGFPR